LGVSPREFLRLHTYGQVNKNPIYGSIIVIISIILVTAFLLLAPNSVQPMATYIAFTLLLLIPIIFIIVILFNHLKKKFLSQEIDDNNIDENDETCSEIHRESNSTIQSPNDKATTATISTICDSPLNYELPPSY
jgi:amino acid permease